MTPAPPFPQIEGTDRPNASETTEEALTAHLSQEFFPLSRKEIMKDFGRCSNGKNCKRKRKCEVYRKLGVFHELQVLILNLSRYLEAH